MMWALAGLVLLSVAAAQVYSVRRKARSQADVMGWRLAAFGETCAELLWEADVDGRITYASQMATALLGYRPEELVGRDVVGTLVADRDRDRKALLLSSSLRQRQGWTDARFSYRTKDGSYRDLVSSALLRVDHAGRVVGFTGILREVAGQDHGTAGSAEARARVARVLAERNITAIFQPILSLATGAMVGAEALSRFTDGAARSPDHWFREATLAGFGVELEITAIQVCLGEAVRELSPDIYLSVNVSPETILSGRLLDLLRGAGWPPRQLVLEITEHVSITEYGCLTARIDELRALGVRLAVDDAGAGFASFRHILRLRPDYIKLDRTLVDCIDADPAKRALAGAVVALGQAVGAVVVAEGIETADELRTARMLGIQSGQGFFIGRPVVATELRTTAALGAGGVRSGTPSTELRPSH